MRPVFRVDLGRAKGQALGAHLMRGSDLQAIMTPESHLAETRGALVSPRCNSAQRSTGRDHWHAVGRARLSETVVVRHHGL